MKIGDSINQINIRTCSDNDMPSNLMKQNYICLDIPKPIDINTSKNMQLLISKLDNR